MGNSNESSRKELADKADSHMHQTDWARSERKRPNDPRISKFAFPADSWKCNLFVSDMLHEAGIKPPLTSSGEWPITAKMWTRDVPGFKKVTTQQRGDIVSDGIHMGIAVDETYVVAAGSSKVYKGTDIVGGTIQRYDPEPEPEPDSKKKDDSCNII